MPSNKSRQQNMNPVMCSSDLTFSCKNECLLIILPRHFQFHSCSNSCPIKRSSKTWNQYGMTFNQSLTAIIMNLLMSILPREENSSSIITLYLHLPSVRTNLYCQFFQENSCSTWVSNKSQQQIYKPMKLIWPFDLTCQQ